MEEFTKGMSGKIKQFYASAGSDLDAHGGVHRCKVCGHETAHQPGDGAKFLKNGWPEHCGQSTKWITQRQLDDGE